MKGKFENKKEMEGLFNHLTRKFVQNETFDDEVKNSITDFKNFISADFDLEHRILSLFQVNGSKVSMDLDDEDISLIEKELNLRRNKNALKVEDEAKEIINVKVLEGTQSENGIDDDYIKSFYDVIHYLRLNNIQGGCIYDLNLLLMDNNYEVLETKTRGDVTKGKCILVNGNWLMKISNIPDLFNDNYFVKLKHNDDLIITA